MNKKNLIAVGTTIEDGILREFKCEVVRKHGQLFSAYKKELTIAIKERTQKLKQEQNPIVMSEKIDIIKKEGEEDER